jgi:tight adherence protein B
VKKRAPIGDGAASVVQRLAVLLAAGVPPPAAWGYLRHDDFTEAIARSSAQLTIPEAIIAALGTLAPSEATVWRGVAAAWAVATDAGAPLAPTLRQFADSLRDLAEAERQVKVALAAPIATARLVMALPAVGVLFGIALGFDTLGTLFTTLPGWICLVVGAALLYAGWRWNRRLVRAAQPGDITPGLELDLIAIAVSGGGSLEGARASALASIARFSPGVTIDRAAVDAVLDLSTRAGVPAAELLRSEALERRRVARASAQESAQRLSVRLMIPLGICVLPAFMVLGVLPLVISVLSSTAVQL